MAWLGEKRISIRDFMVRFSGHFLQRWEERVGGRVEVPEWAIVKIRRILSSRAPGWVLRFRVEGNWFLAALDHMDTKKDVVFITILPHPWLMPGPEWVTLSEDEDPRK
jgi:hypothetical protein